MKINPPRIFFFNQTNLPVAPPFLELFFASDGSCNIIIHLEPHEFVDAVSRRKTIDRGVSGHPQTLSSVGDRRLMVAAQGRDHAGRGHQLLHVPRSPCWRPGMTAGFGVILPNLWQAEILSVQPYQGTPNPMI